MVACGPACRYNTPDGCTAAANRHKCPLSNMVVETAKPRQTNADRVRAMSDEELVDVYRYSDYCPPGKNYITCGTAGTCKDCWLDWIQQHVEVE